MTHPCLPLWVDDFEAATAHLSPEEDGVYNRLLRLAWRTPGCSLPTDHAWISRKVRMSPEHFEQVGAPILAEFFRVNRGRYVQRRLREEYDSISRKKTARQNAGKKGGAAKAAKTNDNSPSNASDLPPDTRALLNHTQTHIQKESSEDKPSGGQAAEPDLDKVAWDGAVHVLTAQGGMTDKAARAFFGKLLSQNVLRAKELLAAIADARVTATLDPQGYLTRIAQSIARRQQGHAAPKRVGFV